MGEHRLAIAGIDLLLRTGDAAWALLAPRYQPFAGSGTADDPTTVTIELRGSPPDIVRQSELRPALREGALTLTGTDIAATLSEDAREAGLMGPMVAWPVDALLRLTLARRLLERGAVLLHASAIVLDGSAWVFAGPSGVGKTTLATTLPGLLSDEAIALEPSPDEPGAVVAHATPFWQGAPGAARVAALLFPSLGAQTRWQPLGPTQALAKLLAAAGPYPLLGAKALLGPAARLAEALPAAAFTLTSLEDITSFLRPRLVSTRARG